MPVYLLPLSLAQSSSQPFLLPFCSQSFAKVAISYYKFPFMINNKKELVMKSQQDFMREFVEKLDEIVRGAFVNPKSDVAIRPANQAERDRIAQGIKASRGFNKDYRDWYAQTDEPDPDTLATLNQRMRGTGSEKVHHGDSERGPEKSKGMPVPDIGDGNWQTGVVNSKRKDNPQFYAGTSASARDGKASEKKIPQFPFSVGGGGFRTQGNRA